MKRYINCGESGHKGGQKMKLIIEIPNYNLNDIQNGSIACSQILKAVKNGIPYEERPHGEWINTFTSYVAYECSCCGLSSPEAYDFCPNCGADMN